MDHNHKITTALIGIILVLTTLLTVFISNALNPNGVKEALGMAGKNYGEIQVIKKELQIELKAIKIAIAEIKTILKERQGN